MSDPLAAQWRQAVIVDNRPGASQLIAASAVAKAKPDGYTLLVATSTPFIQVKFVQKDVPIEVWRDFAPLTVIGVGTVALAAAKNAPFNSVAELIEHGRRAGVRLPYGTWGNGSGGHLIGEGLRAHAKIDLVHVPYRGEAAEITDLLGGNLSVVFLTHATAKAQAEAGKLKLLAVTGTDRFPFMPDVPTFKEQGVPGLEVIGWIGAFAPAAVPPALTQKISSDMQKVLKDPAVAALYAKQGYAATGGTPAQFRKLFLEDEARWKALAQIAALRPE
nr:tripartite tricarboxylate transporter substrate binding protein [Variovorax terrae]